MTDRMLTDARQIQELVMRDECIIERSTGIHTDRTTGLDTEVFETVWEGRCRYPRADATVRSIVTGETITPTGPEVLIPWDAPEVRPDDRVTCTASVSPRMVGRIVWVTANVPRTFESAIHLACREVR